MKQTLSTTACIALLMLGCGEAATGRTPPGETPGVAPAPVSDPPVETPASAEASYRAALAAYSEGRAAEYAEAFADPACASGGQTLSRAAIARARPVSAGEVRVHELRTLRSTADEVVLADFGLWYRSFDEEQAPAGARPYLTASDEMIQQGTHSKLVVMRRYEGVWRIAAETDLADRACVSGELATIEAAPAFVACDRAHRQALRECDRACSGEAPGNSCNVCPEEALCELADCLGVAPIEDYC